MAGTLKVGTITTPSGSGSITIPSGVTLSGGGLANTPAFSVYGSSGTSLPNNTDTKISYDTEDLDTNNNFASSRFTPTVAGYYNLNANVLLAVSAGVLGIIIYKNGSRFKYGVQTVNNTGYVGATVSAVVYANGSTDYFEIYAAQNSGGTVSNLGGSIYNYFQGYKLIGV